MKKVPGLLGVTIGSGRNKPETVNHPPHYNSHPTGIECITIVETFSFNIGNAIKYLWRAGIKSTDTVEDLRKSAWYVNREIERFAKGDKANGSR